MLRPVKAPSFVVCIGVGIGVVATLSACIGDEPVVAGQDAGGVMSQPDGAKALAALGTKCANPSECESGFCVDGLCCNAACTGQCQACDVAGSPGSCVVLAQGGVPHGLRAACLQDPNCGGRCPGNSPECAYPPATAVCGTNCDGFCDGKGACTTTSTLACPNGYTCGSGGCRTSCNNSSECQQNFQCVPNACKRVPESDCLDGIDNNGDGLIDCADPTCTTVECVDDPGSGTLGNLTAGTCDPGFAAAQPEHQGLSADSCPSGACGCSASVTCNASITMYTSTSNCTAGGTTYSLSGTTCRAITQTTYMSSISPQTTVASQSCAASGTSTLPTPSWTTTKSFCPASKTSTSCGAGKVCMQKPSTGQLCVKLAAGATCPSKYAGASSGQYYASYAAGSCACACSVSSASCSGTNEEVQFFTDAACGNFFAYNTGTTTNNCVSGLYNFGAVTFNSKAIGSVKGYSVGGSGTCSRSATLEAASQPTLPDQICCQ
jgi:hypothetical protein